MGDGDARPVGRQGVEVPEDRRLVRFLEYWEAKRGTREMPRRADVDPLELGPELLPLVYLVDVLGDPPDFRYRLVGTDIVAHTPDDYTGRHLSELAGADTQAILTEIYREVCASRAPSVDVIRYVTRGGNVRHYENAVAPLGEGEVVMLIGCAVHHWREGGARRLTIRA